MKKWVYPVEKTIRQVIYYSNKQPIPIRDVAESLIALEDIIRQSPAVLEAMFPGTHILHVEVYIDHLKSDSLLADVAVKFVFGSHSKLDEFIFNTRERIGMDELMNDPNLLSTILLIMILIGGAYYLGRNTTASPEKKATIEANNNTIIQIGAGLVNLEAEDFKTIIDSAIKDKDKLAENAVKLVKPAKRDQDATITFNNNEELRIKNGSVRAMSSSIEESEEEPDIEDFENIQLEIRATDLDSSKQGWGTVIPELHSRRIRMQLDPFIKPIDLRNKETIRGNITVVFGYDKSRNRIPKLVFLREIVD